MIGLWSSFESCWFSLISFLTPLPVDFLSKKLYTIEANLPSDHIFNYLQFQYRDVTNSWLDDKLPLAGLWLFLVEVILSKENSKLLFLPYFKKHET